MLGMAIMFAILALIAGVLGFVTLAGSLALIAKVLLFVFLALFVISLIFGRAEAGSLILEEVSGPPPLGPPSGPNHGGPRGDPPSPRRRFGGEAVKLRTARTASCESRRFSRDKSRRSLRAALRAFRPAWVPRHLRGTFLMSKEWDYRFAPWPHCCSWRLRLSDVSPRGLPNGRG